MYTQFSSESVSEGHPDKIADQISDAILDAFLKKDKNAKVAAETFVAKNFVLVGGEVKSDAHIDIESLVRETIIAIGYDSPKYGFDGNTVQIQNIIAEQSPEITKAVVKQGQRLGAGDQGMMFGYASNETPMYMPAPIVLAHAILKHAAKKRKNDVAYRWMRPDAKCQISMTYDKQGNIQAITDIVMSQQHSEDVTYSQIKEQLCEDLIRPTVQELFSQLDVSQIQYHINSSGNFVLGGPAADAGLTGRKIISDTYGGMGRHGGGAFSGKDPSKVDRSAAYFARYVAKNIVAAGFADRCELQLSYAIGEESPIGFALDCFGTEKQSLATIEKNIARVCSFSPWELIDRLALRDVEYIQTSVYGHFGKAGLPWEQLSLRDELLA